MTMFTVKDKKTKSTTSCKFRNSEISLRKRENIEKMLRNQRRSCKGNPSSHIRNPKMVLPMERYKEDMKKRNTTALVNYRRQRSLVGAPPFTLCRV